MGKGLVFLSAVVMNLKETLRYCHLLHEMHLVPRFNLHVYNWRRVTVAIEYLGSPCNKILLSRTFLTT